MKKKILMAFFVCLLVGISINAGLRVKRTLNVLDKGSLMIENVEALSQPDGPIHKVKCYARIHFDEGSKVVYCSDCKSHVNYTDDLTCFHDYCYRY